MRSAFYVSRATSTNCVRLKHEGENIVSGYYNDLNRLVQDAMRCSADYEAHGTYLTIGRCQPELPNRAINHLRDYVRKDTTSDTNILRRGWIRSTSIQFVPAGSAAFHRRTGNIMPLSPKGERFAMSS